MRKRLLAVGYWLLAALALLPLTARCLTRGEAEETFRQANALFRQANDASAKDPAAAHNLYTQAAMRFERLAGEGGIRNGTIYYNLGNTYFRLGDLGRAILNYRRARLLSPGDPDLNRNLEEARSRRADRIVEPEPQLILKTLFFWHYDVPLRWKRGLFLACWLLLWGFAAFSLFARRGALKWAMAAAGVLSALWLGSLIVDQVALVRDRSGVVIASEVTARKGDGEAYQPSFQEPLHAGAEFTLLSKRPGWWGVRLPDGRDCWVPESSAALVRPG